MPPQDVLATRTAWLRDGQFVRMWMQPAGRARTGVYLFGSAGCAEATTPAVRCRKNHGAFERGGGDRNARLLLADGSGALAPLRVVDYALDGSSEQPILDIGSLVAPRLSPDGRFVAGYDSLTQIDGTLQGAIVIVDLQSGSRFLLSNPPAAWGFRWAAP